MDRLHYAINHTVWEVMAQLGRRLFFCVMDAGTTTTVEDMVKAHSVTQSYKDKVSVCQKEVRQFVEQLFNQFGDVRGVPWNTQGDPRDVLTRIAQCAMLLAVMRTLIPKDASIIAQPELPSRANSVLCNLARGHALVYGRTQLSTEDLPMVARVAVSSIRSGPVRLNSSLSFFSGFSADFHAARSTVGSITA